jgi:modulator of FtsH protease HflC
MSTINVNRRDTGREAWKAVKGLILTIAIVVVALILFNLSTFTVGEGEQAVIFRFGTVSRVILDNAISFTQNNPDLADNIGNKGKSVTPEYGKGLFFRIPFIDQVKKYDSRLLTYESQPAEMNTNDKQKYTITLYAQWRIANPALFYQVYHTIEGAQVVLDDTVEPILVQSINKMLAVDFLSKKEMLNASLVDSLKQMNTAMRSGGVEVVDVQVSRTLLPEANLKSTYDRMVANREMVAQQLRSEGQQGYQESKSDTDLKASVLIADATQKAKQTMGTADAQALQIYAEAYSKDPEFYGFWRSLQALKSSLGHDATIVLDRNSPLWKDLLDMIGLGIVTAK